MWSATHHYVSIITFIRYPLSILLSFLVTCRRRFSSYIWGSVITYTISSYPYKVPYHSYPARGGLMRGGHGVPALVVDGDDGAPGRSSSSLWLPSGCSNGRPRGSDGRLPRCHIPNRSCRGPSQATLHSTHYNIPH